MCQCTSGARCYRATDGCMQCVEWCFEPATKCSARQGFQVGSGGFRGGSDRVIRGSMAPILKARRRPPFGLPKRASQASHDAAIRMRSAVAHPHSERWKVHQNSRPPCREQDAARTPGSARQRPAGAGGGHCGVLRGPAELMRQACHLVYSPQREQARAGGVTRWLTRY